MGFPGAYDKTDNGRQLTSKLWRDFNPAAIAADPGRGWMKIDDYLHLPDVLSYTLTQGGAAGTVTLDAAGANGVLLVTSGDEDAGDGPNVQFHGMGATLAEGVTIAYEVRLKSDQIAHADIFAGLAAADTNITSTFPVDYAGFFVIDDGAGLTFGCQDGTEETSSADVHTLVANTYVKLGCLLKYGEAPEVYVNGEAVATGISSDANPDSIMHPSYQVVGGTTGVAPGPIVSVDWMGVGVLLP